MATQAAAGAAARFQHADAREILPLRPEDVLHVVHRGEREEFARGRSRRRIRILFVLGAHALGDRVAFPLGGPSRLLADHRREASSVDD